MRRLAIAAGILAFTLSTTTGCATVEKLLSGGKVTSADLVREGKKAQREKEQKAARIAELEKGIDEQLTDIQDKRQNGRFSAADYREKTLNKYLEELGELDPENAKVTEAPKRLAELKATYTEELYKKKALAEECAGFAERAKKNRMDEQWRSMDRALESYAKCRRELIDVGGDQAKIAEMDAAILAEYDLFAQHLLQGIEGYRKEQRFSYAVGFEKNLEKKMAYYLEIAPEAAKPAEFKAQMATLQKTYRDPEEIKAEKAQAAFESWKGTVQKAFEREWSSIAAAEQKARPAYDAGIAALDSGDYATAVKKLHEARNLLFAEAYPSAVALDTAVANGMITKGLSYEIASALARVHFEQGNLASLYPELSIIQTGRKWMGKDDELKVRIYDILGDRSGKLAPKATDLVKRYASRYSNEAQNLRLVKEQEKAMLGEAYAMLGVDLSTMTHRKAASNAEENAGKIVFVEEPVSAVAGGKLRFDFQSEYEVPTKCWNTKEVASVNIWTGDVDYVQKCKYKKVKSGYVLVVAQPKGIKVRKGDIVSFYAKVGKKQGKLDLALDEPAFVRIAPKGTTGWYLGVNLKN